MLWLGPSLSTLERLSLVSYLAQGHEVHLYVYEQPLGVPAGVQLKDAASVLPADRIFTYGPRAGPGAGSVAAFSNLFRYKLLLDRGGWWSDTDMVCLRPLQFDAPYVLSWQNEQLLNTALILAPRGCELMAQLYAAAEERGRDVAWGETGPVLFTEKVLLLKLDRFALPPDVFYPIPWQEALRLFEEDPAGSVRTAVGKAWAVHFWNEIARRAGLDKDGAFPVTSVYEDLKRRYADRLAGGPVRSSGLETNFSPEASNPASVNALIDQLGKAQELARQSSDALAVANARIDELQRQLEAAEHRPRWRDAARLFRIVRGAVARLRRR